MHRWIRSHGASDGSKYRGSGHHPTGGQYQTEECGRRTLPAAPVTSGTTGFLNVRSALRTT
jgi:hypothetical protein